tara:strand:+ start:646 stop:960 length:315 start_codon:yes stop_codon:yes gene_type:complete
MYGFKNRPQSPSNISSIDGNKNKYLAAAQFYNNEEDLLNLVQEANFEILNTFLNKANKDVKKRFVTSNDMNEKISILKKHSNDTDDRLWRSDAYMFLEQVMGAR